MRAFRYTQHIDRTREEVFAYMMDFSTAPRWRNLVRRMEIVGGGPLQKGSTILLTLDASGKTIQVPSEIWLYEPPHRCGNTNTANGVTGTFEYRLEADETGTTVSFIGDIRPHGSMWLALPWLLRSLRVRYRDQLATLKRAIEDKR